MTGGGSGGRRLFWVVLGAIVLYIILDALSQSLPPHYSLVGDAESDLAVGPYGYIMAANFVNRGVFSAVFLYALWKTSGGRAGFTPADAGRRFRRGEYLFGVWAVGSFLLAFFPTDVPATPVSWHGAVHLVVAALAFFGGALGAYSISREFGASGVLKPLYRRALTLSVLSVVLLFVGLVTLSGPVGGLTERLFLGMVLLWEAYVSFRLARPWPGTYKD